MGYYSFLCWFTWRMFMAVLAHANWLTALYVKCVYFTLWKSYDLLWFWMHLVLCICFEPLRSENYLLVWCVLIYKKCTSDKNRSFRQIYQSTYNKRFTKSERELKKIETIELADEDEDDDASTVAGSLYPKLSEHTDTGIVVLKRDGKNTKVNFEANVEGQSLVTNDDDKSKKGILKRIPDMMRNRFSSASMNSDTNPDVNGDAKESITMQRLLPAALQRNDDAESVRLREEKQEEKRRKREEKCKLKEIRQRRKEYLRQQAAIERKRRLISDSIELLLQCLRLFTSFAILVGNLHRNFMPAYLKDDGHRLNNPEVLMLFTLTMALDVLLFWISTFMTYCKQCHLCCRMGILKFWVWLGALFFLGGICMYYPMHLAHPQLDMRWCRFEPGTPIGDFLEDGLTGFN